MKKNLHAVVKFSLALFLLQIISYDNAYAQLSGSYTINPGASASSTNYLTFTSAVSDLSSGTRTDGGTANGPGVSGAVTFTVSSATYSENVVVPTSTGHITGASAAHNITFNGGTGNATNVIITSSAGTTLDFNGCSYVTFKNMTITNTNSGNCILLYKSNQDTIEGCSIHGGDYSIYLSTDTSGLISNDSLLGASEYGIFITSSLSFKIKNNYISISEYGIPPGPPNFGIKLISNSSSTSDYAEISGNIIYVFSGYGISLESSSGSSSYPTMIFNNFIGGGIPVGSEINGCVYVVSTNSYINFCNNTLSLNISGGSIHSACLEFSTGTITGWSIENNIFSYTGSNTSDGEAMYSPSGTITGLTMDYNIFYNHVNTSLEATIKGTAYSSSTIIGGGGYNSHSQVINPSFVDTSSSTPDLDINYQCTRGTYISSVTTDIHGTTRANPPTIGADELSTLTVTASASPSTICYNTSSTLTAGGASTYTWSPSTGLSATTGSSVTATLTATTTYTVTGTDVNGCVNTATETISVNPLPTVTASASPSTICYNTTSTLTASGASTYTWSPTTALNDSTGSSVIATLTATTTYTVTGTDSNGCVNTGTTTVTVYPQLFAHSGGNRSFCANSDDTLGSHPTASGGVSPYTYSWFGEMVDSVFSTLANPVIYSNHQDIYTLTVTDSVGCIVGDTALITQFTVNAGISDTIFYGLSDTLGSDSVTSGGVSPFIYSWASNPNGFTSSSSNPVVSPTVTTTYALTVTDNTECIATDTVIITVIKMDSIITLNDPIDSMQTYSLTNSTDTLKWFKFTSDSTFVTISIVGDSASANITALTLICDSCPGFSTLNVAHKTAGDSTKLFVYNNWLTGGKTYYVAVSQPYGNISSYSLEYEASRSIIDSCPWNDSYPLNGTGAQFDSTGWVTIFDDEFANDAALRRDYWSKFDYRTYWKYGSATEPDSTNVELVNGHLRLLQKKISNPTNYIPVTINKVACLDSATNGEITTRRPDATATVSFLPNIYVESEIWLNFADQPETNPAMWMWGGYGCGDTTVMQLYHEIDNFEFLYPNYFNDIDMHIHFAEFCSCKSLNGGSEGSLYNIAKYRPITKYWINWGMLYTPNSVGWYVRNVNIKTDTVKAHITPGPYFLEAGDGIAPITAQEIKPKPIYYDSLNYSWMDFKYIKVYTNTIPLVVEPDSICVDAAFEDTAYPYPGVKYGWQNGTSTIAFGFSSSESGTYTSILNGSTSNDGHAVWIKVNSGITTNTSYPITLKLRGLDGKTLTKTFYVYVSSVPTVTVSPLTSTICCLSETLTASGASSYNWSPSYGLSATTGSSVGAWPVVTTTYTVEGINSPGCVSTATSVVNGPYVVITPGDTISDPDCAGVNCGDDLGVSKEKINANTTVITSQYLKIYPNPNNGSFTLEVFTDTSITTIKVQLFNMFGQMVYEQYNFAANGYLMEQIQPIGITDGVYLVSVYAGKSVSHQKVVINNQ